MENETTGARARHKTRKTIERLLKAAEWSIAKFEEVKGEMVGPLAILEAGKRCTDMALKLQEFERLDAGGSGVIEGEVRYRLIGYQEPEGENDAVDEDAAE